MYLKIKLLLAVTIALVLSVVVYNYFTLITEEATVVLSAKDIRQGEWITSDMVKEVKVRKKEKDMMALDSASSVKELENSISKIDIQKGKPIHLTYDVIRGSKDDLKQQGALGAEGNINMGYFIQNNKRLFSIRVDSSGSVNNSIQKGDFVDVIATFKQNATLGEFSSMVIQHVQVYAVEPLDEKQKNGNKEGAQNVTLILSPEESIKLSFAKRNATLDLALNPVNAKGKSVGYITAKSFVGQEE